MSAHAHLKDKRAAKKKALADPAAHAKAKVGTEQLQKAPGYAAQAALLKPKKHHGKPTEEEEKEGEIEEAEIAAKHGKASSHRKPKISVHMLGKGQGVTGGTTGGTGGGG